MTLIRTPKPLPIEPPTLSWLVEAEHGTPRAIRLDAETTGNWATLRIVKTRRPDGAIELSPDELRDLVDACEACIRQGEIDR